MLLAGCSTTDHSRTPEVASVGTSSIPQVDPAAQRAAQALADEVGAKARKTEKAEGRQDLVKDTVAVKTAPDGQPVVEQLGEASWYGRWHQGKKTANGQRFDQNKLTAAHPTLPLGSEATVTNLENGKQVDVIINDRGPYVKGRDIDLSKAAAQAIGVTKQGAAAVQIEAAVTPSPAPASPH